MSETLGTADKDSTIVTLLFTDIVGSTELLSRSGDDRAQRIFRAHHDLLAEVAGAHGGEEVKWLGDGLMVAFASAADAVRCAITMQEASRRPIQGERLALRVGVHVGEALREADDYFGLPVVVARRLCDLAQAGQILCGDVVVGLLAGRAQFTFTELGDVELKGFPEAIAAYEVGYEVAPGSGLALDTPMVGRDTELERLDGRLAEAVTGRGGLTMVAGEPGIGKTRMLEEVAQHARRRRALVLWGRCFESEWAPPYGPFAEAIGDHIATLGADELRANLNGNAAALAQLLPSVRQILPDVPDAVPLPPNEERFRLLDSVTQFLIARSRQVPILLCLDDLHWADRGTIAMLRHLARFVPRHRLLVLGSYRDTELEAGNPLVDVLPALARETTYEGLRLAGLGPEGARRLLAAMGGHEVPESVGAAWAKQTEGNPLFIRELVRYLAEEGKLFRKEGRWTTGRPLRELGVPPGVRDVVGRRLGRFSDNARRILSVASVFDGPFRFDAAVGVAGLPEDAGLDALDEALAARVLEPSGEPDAYVFTHALARQTLYDDLNPSRRTRLHRRVAEALAVACGAHPSPAQASEIAAQYYRSATLPGAEQGLEAALTAAAHAEATGAHDDAGSFLGMALELLPDADPRRPRLLARLGLALIWGGLFDEGARVAADAGKAIAEAEGPELAADYLAEAASACGMAGSSPHGWGLAWDGLAYAAARRDLTWARLFSFDQERRATEDPELPGLPLDNPERREAARILRAARLDPLGPGPAEAVFESRTEALTSSNLVVLIFWAGEYARCLPLLEAEADSAESHGRVARAARAWAFVATCQIALGRLDEGRQSLARAEALGTRLGVPPFVVLGARESLTAALDQGWDDLAGSFGPVSMSAPPGLRWALGGILGALVRAEARQGNAPAALRALGRLVPWLERAPAWLAYFPLMACHAGEALWVLDRLDHVAAIEDALREKVVGPDLRYAMVDGRLGLARVCALQGRYQEAAEWFAEARRVLDEQGARPLRAIVDYDEALMYAHRGGSADIGTARPLLDAARRQFQALGMSGWIRGAEELRKRLG